MSYGGEGSRSSVPGWPMREARALDYDTVKDDMSLPPPTTNGSKNIIFPNTDQGQYCLIFVVLTEKELLLVRPLLD